MEHDKYDEILNKLMRLNTSSLKRSHDEILKRGLAIIGEHNLDEGDRRLIVEGFRRALGYWDFVMIGNGGKEFRITNAGVVLMREDDGSVTCWLEIGRKKVCFGDVKDLETEMQVLEEGYWQGPGSR